MITINTLGDSFLIENKIVFGNEMEDSKHLFLRLHSNSDDILSTMKKKVIDFPGEYDIENIYVKGIAGQNNLMNYFIKTKGKSFAIIQSKEVLEQDDLQKVDHWLYLKEEVKEKLTQLELTGETINLQELNEQKNEG